MGNSSGPSNRQMTLSVERMLGSTGTLRSPNYGTTSSTGEIFSIRTHLQDMEVITNSPFLYHEL
jgi:hypothetical protein